jgi:hypothetical protein
MSEAGRSPVSRRNVSAVLQLSHNMAGSLGTSLTLLTPQAEIPRDERVVRINALATRAAVRSDLARRSMCYLRPHSTTARRTLWPYLLHSFCLHTSVHLTRALARLSFLSKSLTSTISTQHGRRSALVFCPIASDPRGSQNGRPQGIGTPSVL